MKTSIGIVLEGEQTTYVVLHGERIVRHEVLPNNKLLRSLRVPCVLNLEWETNAGILIDRPDVPAAIWIGRYLELLEQLRCSVRLIDRSVMVPYLHRQALRGIQLVGQLRIAFAVAVAVQDEKIEGEYEECYKGTALFTVPIA